MTSTRRNFDPIGIVVDWLDACRARHLSTLIDLYDDAAIIDCCQGGSFRGRLRHRSVLASEMRPKR